MSRGWDPASGVPLPMHVEALAQRLADSLATADMEAERAASDRASIERELRSLHKRLENMQEGKRMALENAARWEAEAKRLATEIANCQAALREALSAVEKEMGDKRALTDQIRDIVDKYHASEAGAERLRRELRDASNQLGRLDDELSRFQQASKAERTKLVQATVAALQQLRSHLTFSLSGLRVTQQQADPEAKMAFKRAAGLVSPRGDELDVIVRFLPPKQQYVETFGREASASATHHHRFDPTPLTPRPTRFYDDEGRTQLGPVQVAPSAPHVSVPNHVTAHGTVMHSDRPASPRLVAIGKPERPHYVKAGQAADLHRWGVSPRPPPHAKVQPAPGRRAVTPGDSVRLSTRSALPLPPAGLGLQSSVPPTRDSWTAPATEHSNAITPIVPIMTE